MHFQALSTAEVDKMDLMSFSVLNPGEIVYESRDIGPPPPLFEDPAIIKVNICSTEHIKHDVCTIVHSETRRS